MSWRKRKRKGTGSACECIMLRKVFLTQRYNDFSHFFFLVLWVLFFKKADLSKGRLLALMIFSVVCLLSYFISFYIVFIISFFLFSLGLFSQVFEMVPWFIFNLSSFLLYLFKAINIPLNTAFDAFLWLIFVHLLILI